MSRIVTKSYHQTGRQPEIGDVVQLFTGPFGTGIITAIDENKQTLTAHYARLCIDGPEQTLHVIKQSITISLDKLKLEFWTTGASGAPDNRWFNRNPIIVSE